MDARFFSRILQNAFILTLLVLATGAQYETANFTVDNAPTTELAKEFCETAEQCRYDLAILWLGEALPHWSAKCPITVNVGNNLGAGGATSFIFDKGEVYGWEMNIQGSAKRILDSVLPHEITHTVLASHFREPLPRWLDEGAATITEHRSEKENYRQLLRNFLSEDVRKCLPFKRMIALKEYPNDPMPFYAQGFSVIEYLLALGKQADSFEHQRLVRFAETGMKSKDWTLALQKHYGIESLGTLQIAWVKWVDNGYSAEKNLPLVAASETPLEISELTLPKISEPITLVSAKPSPIQEKYGKSVYDKSVTPIPTTMKEGSRAIPIPTIIRGQSSVEPTRYDAVPQPLRR